MVQNYDQVLLFCQASYDKQGKLKGSTVVLLLALLLHSMRVQWDKVLI